MWLLYRHCIGHITLLYVCKTSMCGCFTALYLSHNTTMCITLLGVSVYCVVLVTLEMRNHKPLPIMGQLFELCQRFYQPYCILLKMKCHWFTLRHLPTFYLQMNIFVIRNASKYAKKWENGHLCSKFNTYFPATLKAIIHTEIVWCL